MTVTVVSDLAANCSTLWFHSAAKVLSPKLLYVWLTVSVQVLAECGCLDKYVGDQLTVVDQVTRSMAGQGLVETSIMILNTTRCHTRSQCSWRSTDEMIRPPSARNQPGVSNSE